MKGKYDRLKARRLSSSPLYEELKLDEPGLFTTTTIFDTAPPPRKRHKSIWTRMKQNKAATLLLLAQAATLLLLAQVVPIAAMVLYAAIFRTKW